MDINWKLYRILHLISRTTLKVACVVWHGIWRKEEPTNLYKSVVSLHAFHLATQPFPSFDPPYILAYLVLYVFPLSNTPLEAYQIVYTFREVGIFNYFKNVPPQTERALFKW